jgi:peptide deformylase
MSPYSIRVVGDPVLRKRSEEITEIDGSLVPLVEDMLATMYDAPGIGLAAPQVGIGRRLFVYDLELGDEPGVLINPVITGTDGEWWFEEGCLSIPGEHFEICRPKQIEVTGFDLDGNEVSFEADELMSRLVQHELDHLDGRLMLDLLDEDEAKAARKRVRERRMGPVESDPPERPRRRLSLFS